MKIKLLLIIGLLGFFGVFIFWQSNKPKNLHLKLASFKELPGWEDANMARSLSAFQNSCRTFLRQNPENRVGSQQINLKVKDWHPVCKIAMKINPINQKVARDFFEKWFLPVKFYDNQPVNGLFTGYYLPLLQGSLVKTEEFNVPIYGLPENLIKINLADFGDYQGRLVGRLHKNQLIPYYKRAEINAGAINPSAPVLLWVNNHIDRLFLEIQGSGMVALPDGKIIHLGYAGENGAAYTPIGRVLIERGLMTKENASMQSIRAYLESHPEEILSVINKNDSFVFFRILDKTAALGAQGVNLTPGYSLAVDRKWIPLGSPLWLSTTRPSSKSSNPKTLQRLMIAQDTGGAIRGVVRGDVFWGAGKTATYIAGNMKNQGEYWLLLPRQKASDLI